MFLNVWWTWRVTSTYEGTCVDPNKLITWRLNVSFIDTFMINARSNALIALSKDSTGLQSRWWYKKLKVFHEHCHVLLDVRKIPTESKFYGTIWQISWRLDSLRWTASRTEAQFLNYSGKYFPIFIWYPCWSHAIKIILWLSLLYESCLPDKIPKANLKHSTSSARFSKPMLLKVILTY